MTPHRPARRQSRGIALPAMVFMMVVLGLLLGSGLSLLSQSQHSQVLQLQSARATSAARSAIEWGLWTVSDPTAALTLAPGTAPPCFSAQTLALPAPLSDFTVQVSCTRYPATGEVDEGGLKRATYAITAEASVGTSGAMDHVRRRIEARHTVCRNPGGTAPAYHC
jgi:hypothetical protein